MDDTRIPRRLWAVVFVIFVILTVVFFVMGTVLGGIVTLSFAFWTGVEASGRGQFGG